MSLKATSLHPKNERILDGLAERQDSPETQVSGLFFDTVFWMGR